MPDVRLRDGYTVAERWACRCGDCESHPDGPAMAEERHSLGIYAGRMCDTAWANSGYRDGPAGDFDPADAGETYDAD